MCRCINEHEPLLKCIALWHRFVVYVTWQCTVPAYVLIGLNI